MEFARVYKLESSNGLVYYGSTTQKYLSTRLGQHKSDSKDSTKSNPCASKLLYADGASVTITLVENVKDCKDKYELKARERWYIDNNECVNKAIPGRTRQEYLDDSAEYRSKQTKQYREANKEHILEQKKEYAEENRETIAAYKNLWYQQNKERQLRKASVRIVCECGIETSRGKIARHRKTDRHKKAMAARVIFRFMMLYK